MLIGHGVLSDLETLNSSGMYPCEASMVAEGSILTAIKLWQDKINALVSHVMAPIGCTYIITTCQWIGNLAGTEEECGGVVLD